MITSPNVIATPTWPNCCVFSSTMIAPQPAKTSANVPIASAASFRSRSRLMPPAVAMESPSRPSSAAARLGNWLDDTQAALRGPCRLACLDDRALHTVGDLVRELDGDALEARCLEAREVLVLRERAGNAAHVRAALGALRGCQPVLRHDVADANAAARLQYPRDLGQHRCLVGREVDHAVRDHDVDGVRGQRNLFDHPFQEVHVRHVGVRRVLPCKGEHLVRHVQSVRDAGRADALRRENHVDAAARTEIKHRFAFPQRGDSRRIAAAEGRERRRLRKLAALLRVVECVAEPRRGALTVCTARSATTSATLTSVRDGPRGLGVAAADLLAQLVSRRPHQQHAPFRSATPASFSTASRFSEKYAHLPRCSRSSRPASTSFFRWCDTVGCDKPSGSYSSHAQTGSLLVARRLTIRTRAGSPRVLNSSAVASASSSSMAGAASGVQQVIAVISISVNVSTQIDLSTQDETREPGSKTEPGSAKNRTRGSTSRTWFASFVEPPPSLVSAVQRERILCVTALTAFADVSPRVCAKTSAVLPRPTTLKTRTTLVPTSASEPCRTTRALKRLATRQTSPDCFEARGSATATS